MSRWLISPAKCDRAPPTANVQGNGHAAPMLARRKACGGASGWREVSHRSARNCAVKWNPSARAIPQRARAAIPACCSAQPILRPISVRRSSLLKLKILVGRNEDVEVVAASRSKSPFSPRPTRFCDSTSCSANTHAGGEEATVNRMRMPGDRLGACSNTATATSRATLRKSSRNLSRHSPVSRSSNRYSTGNACASENKEHRPGFGDRQSIRSFTPFRDDTPATACGG